MSNLTAMEDHLGAAIGELAKLDPAPDTVEGRLLDALAGAAQNYERTKYLIGKPEGEDHGKGSSAEGVAEGDRREEPRGS